MECRAGCGACCVAISISSPIPGMPEGKPAGIRCLHLRSDGLCALFNRPERPAVCSAFQAEEMVCGSSRDEALVLIAALEAFSAPGA